MKTSIALIIAFITLTLNVVNAAEVETKGEVATVQHSASNKITVASANTKHSDSTAGECKAVCGLPMANGRIDLPWSEQ